MFADICVSICLLVCLSVAALSYNQWNVLCAYDSESWCCVLQQIVRQSFDTRVINFLLKFFNYQNNNKHSVFMSTE